MLVTMMMLMMNTIFFVIKIKYNYLLVCNAGGEGRGCGKTALGEGLVHGGGVQVGGHRDVTSRVHLYDKMTQISL